MATTLSDLMISVRQRAEMLPAGYSPSLNSTAYFVTDPELIGYIRKSAYKLYDLLIKAYGDDYFVANPVEFQTDGTKDVYALPDGTLYSGADALYKLLGIDLLIQGSSSQWMTIKRFAFAERNRFSPYGAQALYAYSNLRYRLRGKNIWLTPLPQAGLTLRFQYIPRMAPLVALSDALDGISGWEDFVVVDAAISCKDKEESDTSVLMLEKREHVDRIVEMSSNRDAGSPACVADSRGNAGGSPCGDPFGGL